MAAAINEARKNTIILPKDGSLPGRGSTITGVWDRRRPDLDEPNFIGTALRTWLHLTLPPSSVGRSPTAMIALRAKVHGGAPTGRTPSVSDLGKQEAKQETDPCPDHH
ncbi:hypothetical protein GCM10010124_35740 [Pilimelia terevasa]|uniref:Uncharacterized protein n=1 Tax=Pilimelia terevasa TaxID=53372 RepID=A0A8J3BRF3_9ACTN|nr:hypothetical protein [Pilimelia terevasa]GGK39927.1 hypothetical protein GCM10010124_35740 [Pilimelia terevasa]